MNTSNRAGAYSTVQRKAKIRLMLRKPKTIRLPRTLEKELEREFARRGVKESSAGAVDLRQEAIRMRRVPGIVFVDGINGRRAAVSGTGLEVWEIIATLKITCGQIEGDLRLSYQWLTPSQLRAALAYYRLYPEEIDQRIDLDESWTPNRIREEFPFASFGEGIGPVKTIK
jgi:uncharacterized protein (DUF433 family)